ncbi:MAG: DHA2 family efflux MFS transporter permease subunit [Alphaproteobacteria bacterium]
MKDRTGFLAWIGYLAMCLGMFMAVLDIQVVAASLTAIGEALKVGPTKLSWLQTSYLTAEIVSIPLTAWMTQALSLRRMFVFAIGGFTIASGACALSPSFELLIAFRVMQGLCGGMVIPAVFTSAFTHLPENRRTLAATLAGLSAMLAPLVGPAIGGYLTQTWSWHWIFIVNLAPGLLVCVVVAKCVRRDPPQLGALKSLDYIGAGLASAFLASLEILLKEAPARNWSGALVIILGLTCALAASLALWRFRTIAIPYISVRHFKRRNFTIGCVLSFTLGAGLYGSTYLNAVFLGLVRDHNALDIGLVLLVAGGAELFSAPFAAAFATRVAPRILAAVGLVGFAAGILANGYCTPQTDFDELFWPQILRGGSMLFLLLPITRIALDHWPETEMPEASALFNLMRNLGGAIGIAVIDTILQERAPTHVALLTAQLKARDPAAAKAIGLPVDLFLAHVGPVTPYEEIALQGLIKKAALTQAFNESWHVLAILLCASSLLLPFIKSPASASQNLR